MRLTFTLTLLLCVATLFSQDVIVYTDGSEVKAKVTEITDTDVKYKKWENVTGPTYSASKSKIFQLRYENGTSETITSVEQKVTENIATINTTAKYDSLMKKSKNNMQGGIAFIVVGGGLSIPAGIVGFALSNGEPVSYVWPAACLVMGTALLITGPIMIAQSKKQRNAANELKRTAYLLPPSFNYAYNTKLDSRPSFTASLRIGF